MTRNPSPKLWKLLLALTLATLSLACEEGCIRCGPEVDNTPICELCDLYSSFYLSKENKCVQRKIEDCLIPSADQNEYLCAQCKQGKMLDAAAFKCVDVPENKTMTNCRQYSLTGSCIQCFRNYYLKDGKCTPVKVIIENCQVYFNDDLCMQCEDNYFFDVPSAACVKFEAKENCGKHSFGQCNKCQFGFYLSKNPILETKVTNVVGQDIANHVWQSTNFTKYPVSPCVLNDSPHCKKKSNALPSGSTVPLCAECDQGYYLDNSYKCNASPHWKIENCSDYSTLNTCSKCSEGYYLDMNQCKTRTEYIDCQEPDFFYDKCYRCNENYYNDNGVCKLRQYTTVENCKKIERENDECVVCNDGFLLTEDWVKCLPEITNCKNYDVGFMKDATFFTCKECDPSYYLGWSFKVCHHQNVPDCFIFVNGTGVCELCEIGFYLDPGLNICKPFTMAGCLSSEQEANKNECDDCSNLFWKDAQNKCQPISDINCLENETNSKDCQKCKGNFYISPDASTSVKTCTVSQSANLVQFCTESTSEDEDVICTECDNGLTPRDVNIFVKPNIPYCASVQGLTGKCYQCEDETDVIFNISTNKYTCSAASNPNSKCLRLKYQTTAILGDNDGKCSKCRNYGSHFWDDYTCFERSGVVSAQCSKLHQGKDECDICQEGYIGRQVTDVTTLQCADTPVGFNPIANCVVHNSVDPSKCVQCEWSYWLNPEFKCVRADQPIKYSFNTVNTLTIYPYPLSSTSSPTAYCRILRTSSSCLKCFSTHILNRSGFGNYSDGENSGLSYSYPFGTCVSHTDLVQKKVDNDFAGYVDQGECAQALLMTGSHKVCLKCVNGLNANIVKAEFSSDQTTDISANNYPTVQSCKVSPGVEILSRKYTGVWFRIGSTFNNIAYLAKAVNYDTCPNGSDSLIAIIDTDYSTDPQTLVIPGDGITPEPVYKCHNFASGGVANCQVYGAPPSTTSGFDYSTTAKCIACKPGYTATIEASTNDLFITTCTAIVGCDMSNPEKNTWLNSCETCSGAKQHPWKTDGPSGQHFINIAECQDNTIANCLNQDSTMCYHCALGYKINANKLSCDPITPAIDGCSKMAFNPDSVTMDANGYDQFFYMTVDYYRKMYENQALTGPCKTCSAGKAHFNVNTITKNMACSSVATLAAGDLIANCKIYLGNNTKKCYQCEDGFVVNQDITICFDNTKQIYPNCAMMNLTLATPVCISCAINYELHPETKKCITIENCIDTSWEGGQHICYECSEGFMVDKRSNTECVPSSIPNCLYIDDEYFCTMCEAGYVLYEKTSRFKVCVKNPLIDPQVKDFAFKFTELSAGFLFDKVSSTYEVTAPTNSHVRQVCPMSLMQHCKVLNANKADCDECDDGYYLNDATHSCGVKFISNCQKQKNQYECEECETGFYVNQLKYCSPYQIRNCKVKEKTSDTCDECDDGYLKNSTDDTCHLRLVTQCEEFEESEDRCSKCLSSAYMLNEVCHPYTVSGCKEYNENLDQCVSCPDRYYLNSDTGFKCQYNTVQNCNEYRTTANECQLCDITTDDTTHKGNYTYSIGMKCGEFIEVSGCAKYELANNPGQGKCKECKPTHLQIGYDCVLKPNGLRNCLIFDNPDQCHQCTCTHFLNVDTSRCEKVDHSIPHCKYHETKDTCKECESTHLLSEDKKTCTQLQHPACLTWTTVDSCASCPPGYVLARSTDLILTNDKFRLDCVVRIGQCLKYAPVSFDDPTVIQVYTCEICNEGYKPSVDYLTCEPTLYIPHCLTMADHDTCSLCDPDHVLSLDKKSCSSEGQLVGEHCAEGIVSDKIRCSTCAAGYMENPAGLCEKCGGDGCSICSKSDTTKCELCAGGFYMSDVRTCHSNPNNPFDAVKESVDGGDPIPVVNQA